MDWVTINVLDLYLILNVDSCAKEGSHKTGVISDPLGQTHNITSSVNYSCSCKIVLFCSILNSGRTCYILENSDHYRPSGST